MNRIKDAGIRVQGCRVLGNIVLGMRALVSQLALELKMPPTRG